MIKCMLFSVLLSLSLAKHLNTGTEKSQTLRELALQSKNFVIPLNQTGYDYFVSLKPRPYEVVIFFTSRDCKLCD